MSTIDRKIMERIRRATTTFEQAVEVFEMVLPALEKGINSRPDVIALLEEAKIYLLKEQEEARKVVGHMREVAPELTRARYDWAHIEMLEQGREYFMQADKENILGILDLFNTVTLEDALTVSKDETFRKLEEAMNKARVRRASLE